MLDEVTCIVCIEKRVARVDVAILIDSLKCICIFGPQGANLVFGRNKKMLLYVF